MKYNGLLYRVTTFADNKDLVKAAKIGSIVFGAVATIAAPWGVAFVIGLNGLSSINKINDGDFSSGEALTEAGFLLLDVISNKFINISLWFEVLYMNICCSIWTTLISMFIMSLS